jgi:ADP-ribose pyrophosphatase
MSYEVIKSETKFTGRRISVRHDTLIMPDGKEAVRDIVVHNGAACIIPVCDNGDIIFVKQYRHAAGKFTIEIPAGTLEKGEDPYCCAVRELEEETGYKSDNIKFLFKMYSAIGICNEVLHIYTANNLVKGKMHTDEDEFIETIRYSLDESVKMIETGEICDSKTIGAIFMYKNQINK